MAFRFPLNQRLKKILRWGIIVLFALLILYWLIPLPRPLFEADYSTAVWDEEGRLLRAFLNEGEQWYFAPDPERKIPEKLKRATLYFEDRYFYSHPGFNPVSLVRAAWQNLSAGTVKSGASTITMQVIRLALKKRRNLGNKLLEILQAVKLEIRFSKDRILKMYVDHAPYGGNIIGFQAASLMYFDKKPDQLTWAEAAMLAVLPNSPGLISPETNREKLREKRNRLLKKLLDKGVLSLQTYRASLNEPLPRGKGSFFYHAPHLARTLKERAGPKAGHIHTYIRREYQRGVEKLVARHLKYLNSRGIGNGCAIVVETASGRVRAYVGSQDFFDEEHGGQVDGVMAPRSTGSILKPFLYALAMDEGLILPQTRIRDIPSFFGAFSPTNADRQYNGLVSAEEALIRSLNVPAVRLLNGYGFQRFYLFLKSAGISTLFRRPDDYGLTLILGGAETSLYDLAALYCGLGNRGHFAPLRIIKQDRSPGPARRQPLIGPEACHLTLNILKQLKRPGAEYYWEQYQHQYPIAWKTGTSYGQRDAWSLGVTPRWAIGVWVGNFSGEGNNNLSGAACAAPLMFDIFNYLPKQSGDNWFDRRGLHFRSLNLCPDTGFTAGSDCPRTVRVDAPPSLKPLMACPFHQSIFVTLDEKYRVCSRCWQPGQYKRIRRLVYPPDVSQYLREAGVILSSLPPHRPDCPGQDETRPLQIIYPVPRAKIWLPRDFDGNLQKVTLRAAHRSQDRSIYWYLDDVYRGATRDSHKLAVTFKEGWHRLTVVDEDGNRLSRRFYIAVKSTAGN
jgi:penicillin-binding protein 1C